MNCYETLTASGTGFWYKPYQINLLTRHWHYKSRFASEQREFTDYALRFRETEDALWETRVFETETERTQFMAKGITELNLVAPPTASPTKAEYFLGGLIGQSLTFITFVLDYIQADFCGHHFNFYNLPLIYEGSVTLKTGQAGYCDKLVSLIQKTVVGVDEYLDLGLTFEFENSLLVSIPLRVDANYLSPEIAEYHRPDHRWQVWSVGERPFE